MDTQRLSQIKKVEITREEMKNGFYHQNKKIIENFGSKNLKKLIQRYFIEKNFSQDDIEKLQEIIHKSTGEKFQKHTPILQFLYESLTHKILLPNYNLEDQKKFYKETSEIIERTLSRAIETIKEIDVNKYFTMYMPRTGAIRDEFVTGGNITFRKIYLDGIFDAIEIENIYNSGFFVRIPVRIYSDENEQEIKSPTLPENKIASYMESNFEKDGIDSFFVPIEGWELEITLKKLSKNINIDLPGQEQYMEIEIRHYEAVTPEMTDEKIREIVDQTFEHGNIIINDLLKKANIPFKKKMYNFSNDYFLGSIEVQAWWEYLEEDDDDEEISKNKSKSSKEEKEVLEQYRIKMNEKILLNDVGGQEKAKKEIETIIKLIQNENIVRSWWAKTTSGIVFEWPAGTGKTLLAKALASEIDADIFTIKLTDIASDAYINTGSNKVTKLFQEIREKAKTSKKVIVILDEMDALFGNRNDDHSHKEDKKIVNSFLTEMSGFETNDNVIFIGTTNLLESIDPAIIRSGRFSTKIKVDLPDDKAIAQILDIHLQKAAQKSKKFQQILKNFPITEITGILKDKKFSGADIEEMVRIIVQDKALEEIDGKENITLTKTDFENAISKIKKTDTKKSIGFIPS